MERGVGANTVKGKNPNAIKIQMPEIMVRFKPSFVGFSLQGKFKLSVHDKSMYLLLLRLSCCFQRQLPDPLSSPKVMHQFASMTCNVIDSVIQISVCGYQCLYCVSYCYQVIASHQYLNHCFYLIMSHTACVCSYN